MTRTNFDEVTDDAFIKQLVDNGCKLFMLVEYTPVIAGTEDWVLSEEQKNKVIAIRNGFRKKYSAIFIALPWDEEEIGGCLPAGRGFIHVSAEGNVELCPFIAYSDTNLKNLPLKEAFSRRCSKPYVKTTRNSKKSKAAPFGRSRSGLSHWLRCL
jgi:MoaA/NifB/PqqE/SkfB family radical SAM enzyme